MDRVEVQRQLEALRVSAQAVKAKIKPCKLSGGDPTELIGEHRRLSTEIERLQQLLDSAGSDGGSPTGLAGDRLHVSLITTHEGLLTLSDDWNELLKRTGTQSAFSTWEWLYTWWEVYGKGKQLRVVLVRDAEGLLVGAAPLMLGKRQRGGSRLHHDCLGLIGTGEGPLADTLTIPHDSALRKEILSAIWHQCLELPDEWNYLELEDLCPVDPGLLILQKIALCEQYMVVAETTRLAVEGELPQTFDAYVDGLEHARRRKHLRALPRRLMRDFGEVEYLRINDIGQVDQYLQELASLSKHRFGDMGRHSAWDSPLLAHCVHRAVSRLHARGLVRLHVLRVDGTTAAILLGFATGNTYQCFQPVFSGKLARYSPLHCLLGHCIQDVIAEGLSRFDFLAGEHGYKTEYFDGRRPVGRIVIGKQEPRFWQTAGSQLILRSAKKRLKTALASWHGREPRDSEG